MLTHGPSCLEGPVTRARPWWLLAQQVPRTRTRTMKNPIPNPQPDDRPIRHDLVERIRREIADGTYETPEKWEAALERLLERLEEE
jgi:hypothetical protein